MPHICAVIKHNLLITLCICRAFFIYLIPSSDFIQAMASTLASCSCAKSATSSALFQNLMMGRLQNYSTVSAVSALTPRLSAATSTKFREIKRRQISTSAKMSTAKTWQHTVTMDNLNPCIKTMEYAVRGPLVIRATEIEKELQNVSIYFVLPYFVLECRWMLTVKAPSGLYYLSSLHTVFSRK